MHTYNLRDHLKYPDLPLCIQKGFHNRAFHTHNHDFGELVIVMEGTAVHRVAAKNYNICEGDVFVINGALPHGFERADKLRLFNIMYNYTKPIFDKPSLRALPGYQSMFTIGPRLRGREGFRSWSNLQGEDRTIAKRLVSDMYAEYQNGLAGFREMLIAQLHQLLVHLARCYQADTGIQHRGLLPLARAIAFMENSYTQPNIGVEEIANVACVSTRQLARLFSRYMDSTPIQYLRQMRLNRAADCLRFEPEKQISSVAYICGFSDANYFTRAFKQHFGLSPRDYRYKYSA